MKIWFASTPANGADFGPVETGRYAPAATAAPAGSLAAVELDFDPAGAADVGAWLIPAGLSGDTELAAKISATGKPVMTAVNGLGRIAYETVATAIGGRALINLFDAREQDNVSYLEQLAWLAAQPAPFAVMAMSTEKLVQATAVGAAHLVVPDSFVGDIAAVVRIAAAASKGGARPTSAAEIDHLMGREASLTVRLPKTAGETLAADDLAVTTTESRGLSPTLRSRVVGRVLRYDIKPDEPLTFGHLMVGEFS